jgi:MSHA pilin protein MshA
MSKANQGGFTLIELVVVIVILGILSAFAVPRFMGLEVQARKASVEALTGSLRSASMLAHSVWLANGSTGDVTVEGKTIVIANGYPDAATLKEALQDTSGFTPTIGTKVVTFARAGAATPANCSVKYTEAEAGGAPLIEPDLSKC